MSDIKTKNKPLLRAYLINGEDALKRDTVIKHLHDRVAQEGDLSFNSDEFHGDTASGADIVVACNVVPFASKVRLVEVHEADKLAKADSEALVTYLQQPCPSTVLALIADKLAKNTRLYKAVAAQGKTAIIDCAPQKKSELPRMVRSLAVNHGVTFTEGAARTLVELAGEDTVRLDSEVRKIALAHRGSDPVTDHEVTSLVARTSEVKPWEFVDALCERNLQKCLRYLGRMESVSPHALIALCTARFRELICARSLYERGESSRLASSLKLPDWRVKNHLRWARGFSKKELRNALISARTTEQAMKSGTDPHDAFLTWVFMVVQKTR